MFNEEHNFSTDRKVQYGVEVIYSTSIRPPQWIAFDSVEDRDRFLLSVQAPMWKKIKETLDFSRGSCSEEDARARCVEVDEDPDRIWRAHGVEWVSLATRWAVEAYGKWEFEEDSEDEPPEPKPDAYVTIHRVLTAIETRDLLTYLKSEDQGSEIDVVGSDSAGRDLIIRFTYEGGLRAAVSDAHGWRSLEELAYPLTLKVARFERADALKGVS